MTNGSLTQVVRQRRWRAALPVGAVLILAGAVAFIVSRNPYATSVTGPCLMLHVTGLYCPGCGGTRAVYSLATGDVIGALEMNAFVVLLVIPPVILGLLWWLLHSLDVKVPRVRVGTPVVWSYVGVLLLFAVMRNIPALEPLLAPI